MNVNIYQIKRSSTAKYLFMDYDFAKTHNFNLIDYALVYSCKYPDNTTLDDIFTDFNIRRPEDFTGHSLSVSDIIETKDGKFYVDDWGFAKI